MTIAFHLFEWHHFDNCLYETFSVFWFKNSFFPKFTIIAYCQLIIILKVNCQLEMEKLAEYEISSIFRLVYCTICENV